MLNQFFQMGAPAAFAIVGTIVSFVGGIIILRIAKNNHIEDLNRQEYERIEQASRLKQIEASKGRKTAKDEE